VLALSIQEQGADPFDKIRAFRKEHKVTYPILSDQNATVIGKFGFAGIPSTVIIDKNGKYVGTMDSMAQVAAKLQKLAK
jgi:peroxiredoxin